MKRSLDRETLFDRAIRVIKDEGVWLFFVKAFDFFCLKLRMLKYRIASVFLRIFASRAIERIRNFRSEDPEEVFSFVWSFCLGAMRPMQLREEFIELLRMVKQKNPKYIMEIGTAGGGTLFCFCKLAREDAVIISLDLPLPEFEAEWRMQIYEAFKKSNQKLYFLRMDSHDVKTLEKVKEIIGEEKLEFLLIDGDHTYEGAKKDYQMYSLLVKQGGLIAFHDIVAPPYRVASCEVNRLWNELKQESNYKEFVKSPKQRWAGIGVIIK